MSALRSLQEQFQNALLHDQHLPHQQLRNEDAQRFGVYRYAYPARLRAALRDNYEVLPQVMGDDAFDTLAAAYIQAHPSRHYSLRWFGDQMYAFMQQHPNLVDHPAIIDLACMEWALRSAFDAPNAIPLSAEELSAIPPTEWADLQLLLHPSAQLLTLQWAVGPIWHALHAVQDGQEGQDGLAAPEALAHHMLVWRLGLGTQWKTLSISETVFVQGLQAQRSFGQICAQLAQTVGEANAAASAVAALRQLLSQGAVCRLPDPPIPQYPD